MKTLLNYKQNLKNLGKFKQIFLEKRIVLRKFVKFQQQIYLKKNVINNKKEFKRQLNLNEKKIINKQHKFKYNYIKKIFYIYLKKTKSNFFVLF